MNSAIKTENITKSYGTSQALKGINLEIGHGEIFGLIGPDGAGKTSFIRILCTLILPSGGSASVLGLDVVKDFKKIRKILGYMPGKFSLYTDLTVEENLNLFATIFGASVRENYHLVENIYSHIEKFKNRRAGNLSGGMKQKLALSCALIHKPEILFLDEPTTGVDAVSRKEFWEMLKKLNSGGLTILVSTPYMDEASLCDRIALLQEGNIMAVNTPAGIIGNFNKKLYELSADDKYKLLNDIRTFPHALIAYPFGEKIHYADLRQDVDENGLIQYLNKAGNKNLSVREAPPNIEDCFIDLMTKNR